MGKHQQTSSKKLRGKMQSKQVCFGDCSRLSKLSFLLAVAEAASYSHHLKKQIEEVG